jgi:hypothetical protein
MTGVTRRAFSVVRCIYALIIDARISSACDVVITLRRHCRGVRARIGGQVALISGTDIAVIALAVVETAAYNRRLHTAC